MHRNFRAIGLSYMNAPLEIRELVALNEDAGKSLLKYFKEYTKLTDVFILSTCNRTEIYYTSPTDQRKDIIKLIGLERSINELDEVSPYFISYQGFEAIQHLFNVAIGLEAQVVGDMQISNQVKNAYQWSADQELAGPLLHRLMHTIFFTNKRVVQETSFKDGAASVSYAATDLVSDLTQAVNDPKILLVGLGEIGEDVCRNLADQNFKKVWISNRTKSKARQIANECGFQTVPFQDVYEAIEDADVVISSIVSDEPFINKHSLSGKEVLSYKYFIDLSVPRSIDSNLEEIPGILTYNIDQIKSKASDALNKRLNSIPQVKKIIEESVAEFGNWTKEMEVSPIINKLKEALERIRQEELSKYLKNLDSEESKKLDQITKSMMQKIIKLPVLQLKAACKRGEAETLIDVLNDLFDLEKTANNKTK